MKKLSQLTLAGVTVALSSSLYLGIREYPFDLVGVKFCPKTANTRLGNYEQSQQELDRKYCQYEHKMLKEVWKKQQRESSNPLPETSFIIRNLPGDKSGHLWLLLAPVSMAVAYFCYAKLLEETENNLSIELEGFKTQVSLTGFRGRIERDTKKEVIQRQIDASRVKAGFVSVEAIQDQLKRQQEIQDRQHASALKSFELNDSRADKEIAENLKDKAVADKDRLKTEGKKSSPVSSSSNSNVDSIVEAVKQHEDGWLFDLINSVKPIFLIGDMGSAKTSMAVSIGLIREALGHRIHRIADKHLNGENSDKWNLLKAECKHDNNSSILEALEEQIERRSERINQRPADKEQFILDEFTQLAKISKEAKELIPLFVTSTYSDTRKAKELFIGVTHSFTNASFGDGVYELRQRGWLIEKFSVDGEKPIPRVVIKTGLKDKDGNNLEDVEKTLPSWFRPEIISKHLQGKKIIEF